MQKIDELNIGTPLERFPQQVSWRYIYYFTYWKI